jgi:nitrous oxidase accessory protein NosD
VKAAHLAVVLGIRSGAALVLVSSTLLAATTWHVDAASACPGAGTPGDPFCSVQTAIDAAADGDTILVAPGTYLERIDFLGKQVVVQTTGGPAVTILDAGGLGSVATFANGEGPGATLRGFTLRNGSGTDTGAPFLPLAGGGVYCRDASPTIRDNVIEGNGADLGGGLALLGGNPLVLDNVIRNNGAIRGGGVHCGAGTLARLVGNSILSNGPSGGEGGGLHVLDAAPTIEGNLIEDNVATWAAGVYIESALPVVVRANVIRGNHTDEDEAGGLCVWEGAATLVEGNEISGNHCFGNGSGLYARRGTYRDNRIADNVVGLLAAGSSSGPPILLRRVTISGTTGDEAVSVLGGQAILEDCLIVGNLEGVMANGATTSVSVRRCTFSDNVFSAVVTHDGAQAVVESSIAWGNALTTGLELAPATGGIAASWSIVRLGYPGVGNLDADPLFASAPDGDYSLLAGSPAIDAGDPADPVCGFDLAAAPRRLDGLLDGTSRVDMGALEFGNVHLVLEIVPPAGLQIVVDGTPGLVVLLLAGAQPGVTCFETWGTLGIDPSAGLVSLPWGTVPSDVTLRVPPAASGLTLYAQALAGQGPPTTGNLSNLAEVVLP